LMATSHTPKTRPVNGAQWLHDRIRRRLVARFQSSGYNRGRWVSPIGTGLFVVVVSTTWAIASVSLWWVPVYLVLIVLIFVMPPRWRTSSFKSESGEESDSVGIVKLDAALEIDCGDGLDDQSDSQFVSEPTNVDPAALNGSYPNLNMAGATRRRGRGRARKVTNPALEPVTNSLPVVWIQVGPGKFIRVEGSGQTADVASAREATTQDLPVTATPTETTPAVQAQAAPPTELKKYPSTGVFPAEIETISISNASVSTSVSEEYGIAPSAFGLAKTLDSPATASDHELSRHIDQLDVMITNPAESSDAPVASSADSISPFGQPRPARRWVKRKQRGIDRLVPRVDRLSLRRVTPASPSHRLLLGRSCPQNESRRDAACRAFGRIVHAQRTLRIRSPPRR